MRRDAEAANRIAILAHEAATEPAKWKDVVRAIANSVDATGAALFTRPGTPRCRELAFAWGSTADAMQPYLKDWAAMDPWENAIAQGFMFRAAGEVRTGNEMLPTRSLRRTAFYNDFARRYELEVLFALKICDGVGAETSVAQISCFRPPGAEEFSHQDRRFLSELWPHLQRAVQTCWSLRKAHAAGYLASDLLDDLPQPVLVLTLNATIIFANAAARQLMASGACVKTCAGTLSGIGDLQGNEILSTLKLADTGGGRGLIATVEQGGSICRVVVRVAPINRESSSRAAWPQAHALLIVELPASIASEAAWLAWFASRWQLTSAEGKVLQRLAAGSPLPDISRELALSYATVRSQLQSIFNKTGCRRQAELIRQLHGGPIGRP